MKTKGNLTWIRNCVAITTKEVVVTFYAALVRLQLEYCFQFGTPHSKKDTELQECVHKRATKLVKGQEKKDKPRQLGLFSLDNETEERPHPFLQLPERRLQ